MTPSAHIQAVIDLLEDLEARLVPADGLCRRYFKECRYIGSKDRKAISELFFGVLRYKASSLWAVQEAGLKSAPRLLMLAYLKLHKNKRLKDIEVLFSGEKYAPPTLSDVEKKFILQEAEGQPEWAYFEVPEWTYPLFKKAYPESFQPELRALLKNAPLDLRVNTLKATPVQVLEGFSKLKIDTEQLDLSPNAIRIPRGTPLSNTELFKQGWVEVQDQGSQVLIDKCDVKPRMKVLDLCAGAGGKTLGLAAALENTGRLVACDIAENRLKQASLRMRRAGVHNCEVRPLNDKGYKWLKRQKETFDRVLVDAPCSGSGTWRRNPDLKWRFQEADLKEVTQKQRDILNLAATLVKLEGKLIYATCSLFCEENEEIVAQFLESHPDYQCVEMTRLSPYKNDTDGFFCAVLKKVA